MEEAPAFAICEFSRRCIGVQWRSMRKGDRIAAFVEGLEAGADPGLSRCYTGYFVCFNAGRYYEAHDVLEHLWLECRDENHAYYKGLIQIAGGFVHLQKQQLRPAHPKDGARLRPAVRLFRLGAANLAPYCPIHLRFDVESLCRLAQGLADEIIASEFMRNPWRPDRLPQLRLLPP
jgi:hypothetical protein